MKPIRFFFLLPVVLAFSCSTPFISPDSAYISYEGRVFATDSAMVLSWPGTSVSLAFEGSEVSAILQDLDTANYYNVLVDGAVTAKIHTDSLKKTYVLATGLPTGKHTVQLFKRTEWDKGKTLFYGFRLGKRTKALEAPSPKTRKIEFYGNSITCGYANEDVEGKDRWFGYYENNYLSYAALTARHFNAAYSCIGKSGIGITVSWFPMVMPEMYDRLDPTDASSKWDFSAFTPDVVVVNLFQNDSWLVQKPEHPEFIRQFGTQAPDASSLIHAYSRFIAELRAKYPDSHIICALGSMDATRDGSAWPGYIQASIQQMNDPKLHACFFPYKNTGGHPLVSEHEVMADSLIAFIERTISW